MKMKLFIGWVLLTVVSTAPAALYTYYWDNLPNGGAIPDASASGYENSHTISDILDSRILDVNVTLNISGGYNGDLYGYLVHDSGFAVLLNRVGRGNSSGFGYGDAGFGPDASANRFTLDDDQGSDVHLYGAGSYNLNNGHLTGTWQPDGRDIDPLSSRATFETAERDKLLSAMDGGNPNGTWTLFLADLAGYNRSTLVGWGLEIDAVPEPVAIALGLFAVGFGVVQLVSWLRRRTGAKDSG